MSMTIKAISQLDELHQAAVFKQALNISAYAMAEYETNFTNDNPNISATYESEYKTGPDGIKQPLLLDMSYFDKDGQWKSKKFNFSHFLKYMTDQFIELAKKSAGGLTKEEADAYYLHRQLKETGVPEETITKWFTVTGHELIVNNGAKFTGKPTDTGTTAIQDVLFDKHAKVTIVNTLSCAGLNEDSSYVPGLVTPQISVDSHNAQDRIDSKIDKLTITNNLTTDENCNVKLKGKVETVKQLSCVGGLTATGNINALNIIASNISATEISATTYNGNNLDIRFSNDLSTFKINDTDGIAANTQIKCIGLDAGNGDIKTTGSFIGQVHVEVETVHAQALKLSNDDGDTYFEITNAGVNSTVPITCTQLNANERIEIGNTSNSQEYSAITNSGKYTVIDKLKTEELHVYRDGDCSSCHKIKDTDNGIFIDKLKVGSEADENNFTVSGGAKFQNNLQASTAEFTSKVSFGSTTEFTEGITAKSFIQSDGGGQLTNEGFKSSKVAELTARAAYWS